MRTMSNSYLAGNFAPKSDEVTAHELRGRARSPPSSRRFLRIGPNPLSNEDGASYHWFTDLMVHGVRLWMGAEWYASAGSAPTG